MTNLRALIRCGGFRRSGDGFSIRLSILGLSVLGLTAGMMTVSATLQAQGKPTQVEPEGDKTFGEAIIPKLPEPFATESVTKHPKVVGWPEGKTPKAPDGFTVSVFSDQVASPRWIYVLPNKDVLVAESSTTKKQSPNRLILFRDTDGDGTPDLREVFLDDLNQPFGMLLLGKSFYVANTDAVLKFDYDEGATRLTGEGEKILDLPAGGYNNHWTRNLIAGPDGDSIYVSVGSATNVDEERIDEKDQRRAAILRIQADGSNMEVYASGLRNPVGMGWAPGTKTLWTAVNERDHLGDDLVPDYLTSVQEGKFYGWPYAYFGKNVDPRKKGERPDLVEQSLVPDYPLGSHTASLGLAFYDADAFPDKYQGGAFIGQRGSWNRSEFVGYRVVFVPFADGKPSGPQEPFLTGFIANESEVYGRPVGVAVGPEGSLLVADEMGKKIWRVTKK